MVNVNVCVSDPVPADARARPVYRNVQVPEDLPMFRRKSCAAVLSVTSGADVPCVGLKARALRVYFGATRFVAMVIFLRELFIPHRRLVAVLTTGPIKFCPATTSALPIDRLVDPALS